jgi:hypothetical protein
MARRSARRYSVGRLVARCGRCDRCATVGFAGTAG